MFAITVVMPCYNRSYDLKRILEAYDAQDFNAPFELIAVDDASTDETFEIITSYTPNRYTLRAIRQPTNLGPAAARNRGIALASAPLILFVGDDILPSPSLVRGHVEAHLQYPHQGVAILGHVRWADDLPQNTLMKHIDGVGAQQFSYYYLKSGQEYDYRHFYTANISLKRDLLLAEPTWFDTNFPHAAFEDVELAYRLTKHGLRIIYQAHLTAQHYHYHTIRTFARRQYHSGLMAWRLMRKHPRTASDILRLRPLLFALLQYCRRKKVIHLQPEEAEELALRLASFYEWCSHLLLDTLYIRVLDYFYYKGLLEKPFNSDNNSPAWHFVHAATTHSFLTTTIKWFVRESIKRSLPYPADIVNAIR